MKLAKPEPNRSHINVRLPEAQVRRLKAIAKLSGVSVTQIIEHAIGRFLGYYKGKAK